MFRDSKNSLNKTHTISLDEEEEQIPKSPKSPKKKANSSFSKSVCPEKMEIEDKDKQDSMLQNKTNRHKDNPIEKKTPNPQNISVNLSKKTDEEEVLEESLMLLYQEEKTQETIPLYDYMKYQPDLQWTMRAILFDWISDSAETLELDLETVFITTHIIDCFLSRKQVKRTELQLLGVSALLIATKFQEKYCIQPNDLAEMTQNAYTPEEIRNLETTILAELNFDVYNSSSLLFFETLAKLLKFSQRQRHLGWLFLEGTLLNAQILYFKPSTVAFACAYIVMKMSGMNHSKLYDLVMFKETGLKEFVKECARTLCNSMKNLSKSKLIAIKNKYKKEKYNCVYDLIDGEKENKK